MPIATVQIIRIEAEELYYLAAKNIARRTTGQRRMKRYAAGINDDVALLADRW